MTISIAFARSPSCGAPVIQPSTWSSTTTVALGSGGSLVTNRNATPSAVPAWDASASGAPPAGWASIARSAVCARSSAMSAAPASSRPIAIATCARSTSALVARIAIPALSAIADDVEVTLSAWPADRTTAATLRVPATRSAMSKR